MDEIIKKVKEKDPDQKEFQQAVNEVLTTLKPVLEARPEFKSVVERLVEPERIVTFRVCWVDGKGETHVNRGFRVQFSSSLGPYKGGLRFHPSVNLSILKFLGFEQTLKNSLTGLSLGGGKGGSDFDPKGKSDTDVMLFCQAFMSELQRHVGQFTDVPAGDIGVGGREIGYLFGQYKRLRNEFTGVLTGKGPEWGGSLLRPEATGYGVCYILEKLMDEERGHSLKGKRVLLSGSGNVAQYCAEKLIELGAKVLTLSDSSGHVYEKDGFTADQLKKVMELKNVKRARISEYASWSKSASYVDSQNAWQYEADIAVPAATQNEITLDDAQRLVNELKVLVIVEASNMPSTNDAIDFYREKIKDSLLVIPAKAANAGGVAVSGLEMAQNSQRGQPWTREKVDQTLKDIMHTIFDNIKEAAKKYSSVGPTDFILGANCAGFERVAQAMLDQGVV